MKSGWEHGKQIKGKNITGNGFTMSDKPAIVLLCTDESDMMDVTNVVLKPDPPKKGSNLTVEINGYLKETMLPEAYLVAKVKKGGIKFPQFHISACDYLAGGCPVEKGLTKLAMTFEIPSLMPGGDYEIQTELWNKKKEQDVYKGKILKFFDKAMLQEGDQRVLCVQGSIEL